MDNEIGQILRKKAKEDFWNAPPDVPSVPLLSPRLFKLLLPESNEGKEVWVNAEVPSCCSVVMVAL